MANKRSKSERIGDLGEAGVRLIFANWNWTVTEVEKIKNATDFIVTIHDTQDKSEAAPGDFFVQVKSTEECTKVGGCIAYDAERDHVESWLQRGLPVLLVVWDTSKKLGYWCVTNTLRPPATGKHRVKIPKAQLFKLESCSAIRAAIEPWSWPAVRSGFKRPLELEPEKRDKAFPFKLANLPEPFVQGKVLDVLLITGPTRYDVANNKERFKENHGVFVDLRRKNTIILGDSAYNLALGAEILSTLSHIAGRIGCSMAAPRIQMPYPEIDEKLLADHNLILLPCGDVNPIVPLAFRRYEMMYRVIAPAHHDPYDSSESVCDERTRLDNGEALKYEKQSGDEAVGFITLLPNPWNKKKAMLICGGNRGTGTQGALLRVVEALRGTKMLMDPRGIPAAIVRVDASPAQFNITSVVDVPWEPPQTGRPKSEKSPARKQLCSVRRYKT